MSKEDENIDELLSGYIDGELTARGKTEVERLIKHDMQISERLEELQRTVLLHLKIGSSLWKKLRPELCCRALWRLLRCRLFSQG